MRHDSSTDIKELLAGLRSFVDREVMTVAEQLADVIRSERVTPEYFEL